MAYSRIAVLTTANAIGQSAREAGVEIELEKVTDTAEFMGVGVISTPGVVVDGEVVHAGGVPGPDQRMRLDARIARASLRPLSMTRSFAHG